MALDCAALEELGFDVALPFGTDDDDEDDEDDEEEDDDVCEVGRDLDLFLLWSSSSSTNRFGGLRTRPEPLMLHNACVPPRRLWPRPRPQHQRPDGH